MSTHINCTFEICTEENTAHLKDDIVAIYEDKTEQAQGLRPKARLVPSDSITNMARTNYVHISDIPVGDTDIVRMLTGTLYKPPTMEHDPHSGGVKWIRQYKIDLARFVAEKSPTVLQNQIITYWNEVKDYVIDRETGEPVEFVTIGNRTHLRRRKAWSTRFAM